MAIAPGEVTAARRLPEAGRWLVVDVVPPWPYRLPRGGGPDGVSRVRGGIYERFLRIDGGGVLVRAWQRPRERRVMIGAVALELRDAGGGRASARDGQPRRPAEPDDSRDRGRGVPAEGEQLEHAIGLIRHSLGVDDDLRPFARLFRRDPLLGPAIRRLPWLRVRRCVRPWEALSWAITEQLIEASRAAAIQRRIVARWGETVELAPGRRLWEVPGPGTIAGLAPAELAALDLAPKRAIALVRAAREVVAGRCDLDRPEDDRRLIAIPEIGPWTIRCLALKGRGELDALPAGDLAYVKLVGRLLGLDRRATVEEVERFYEPYAPYRGLAGRLTLIAHGRLVRQGPPQRLAPDARADAA